MNDKEIIELYLTRCETAISETSRKYGSYCATIAGNVLDTPEDVEEVVSDTWLHAWSSIPPQQPNNLKLYLARIARNLSFDKFRSQNRQKRGGGEVTLALEELAQCVSAPGSPGDRLAAQTLRDAINRFLDSLSVRERKIFLLRYFRVEDHRSIARQCGIRETAVRTSLSRTRKKLKEFLQKEELYYE